MRVNQRRKNGRKQTNKSFDSAKSGNHYDPSGRAPWFFADGTDEVSACWPAGTSKSGVYALSEEFSDEMYVLSLRSDFFVFSHETALFLHGLAERAPLRYSVTIPANRSVSPIFRREVQCFYIHPALFSLGMTKKETGFGHSVPCYDLERTICDLVRSRNRLEAETVFQALKAYARRKNRNLLQLLRYAKLLRVEKVLRLMLEIS